MRFLLHLNKCLPRKLFSSLIGAGILTMLVLGADAEVSDTFLFDSSETSNFVAGSAESDRERNLTSEEIDKIIADLKTTTNINGALEKLDDMIIRAELMDNQALREYAQNAKQSVILQRDLDTVNSQVSAMTKKNTEIQAVDTELRKVINVRTIVEDLQGAVSNEALLVLESLSEENVKILGSLKAEIENLVDLNDINNFTLRQRALLDVITMYEVISRNMVSAERNIAANNVLSIAITTLKTFEKERYGTQEYANLVNMSANLATRGKKATAVTPEQICFESGIFTLKFAPIMYDGYYLVAIEDLYQYINASIEYMYNNANMIIKSPGKILEITAGKNAAFLNDSPKSISVPILNFNGKIYMAVDFFAEVYDISYRFIPEYEFIIMYKNLNQLEQPGVPNQINRS